VARRRNRREDLAGLRIDLVDARLGDLPQVPAVEGGAGVGRALEGPRRLAARRIERDQRVAERDPDRGCRRG
jgi:hypothetical protein